MPARRALTGIALALLAGALSTGCGTEDDRDQVRAVVDRFYDAVRRDDGQAACDQLSQSTREELESQEERPCDEAVTRLNFEGGAIADADVYITNAEVGLRTGEHAFLSQERGAWKLSAIGCRAQEGRPRDRPFDCEAEA